MPKHALFVYLHLNYLAGGVFLNVVLFLHRLAQTFSGSPKGLQSLLFPSGCHWETGWHYCFHFLPVSVRIPS